MRIWRSTGRCNNQRIVWCARNWAHTTQIELKITARIRSHLSNIDLRAAAAAAATAAVAN